VGGGKETPNGLRPKESALTVEPSDLVDKNIPDNQGGKRVKREEVVWGGGWSLLCTSSKKKGPTIDLPERKQNIKAKLLN